MKRFTFFRGLRTWWREGVARLGLRRSAGKFLGETWEFVRESTPSRRRQRFGDIEFDLDHRVDTTSARVPLRTRLRGLVASAYQPTDPALFHEIIQALGLNWHDFSFIDIGSGKGRTLLMASEYPFRRIVGVEVLAELHEIALQNIRKYSAEHSRGRLCHTGCTAIDAICGDAREFVFPREPSLVYLFNSLPEPGLATVVANLERSLAETPRPVYVVYHNPEHECLLAESTLLHKTMATQSYVVYTSQERG